MNITARAPKIAMGLSSTFLVLLAMLHLLEPEFAPSWRMISEYEIGRFGWLMSLAFLCWSGSALATMLSLRASLAGRRGVVIQAWFILLAVALIGAALFVTNPIMDETPNLSHLVHKTCGALVVLTFPMLAIFTTRTLRSYPAWETSMPALRWMTRLTWLSLLSFFSSMIISRMLHPEAGRVGPHVLLGWPNRVMVVAYHAWLMFISSRAEKISSSTIT